MPVSSLPPSKKRKISSSEDKTSRIQQLETELNLAISNNTSINTLVDLLEISKSAEEPQICSKSIYALYRIFVALIASGRLDLKGDENAKVVRAWIREKLNAYTDLLVGLMNDSEKSLRVSAISNYRFVQAEKSSDIIASNFIFFA
jgi:U3 small nucleolar RNA-associated protein 19